MGFVRNEVGVRKAGCTELSHHMSHVLILIEYLSEKYAWGTDCRVEVQTSDCRVGVSQRCCES